MSTGLVWIDGSLVPADQASVDVQDRGFMVGYGVFETLRTVDGQPFALTRHLDRLGRSARGLGLPDPDPAVVRTAVHQTLASRDVVGPDIRIRITYTGGAQPSAGVVRPTLVVALLPWLDRGRTAAIVSAPWPRNERGPLVGLKTTSHAENVVALAYATERGCGEAVWGNTAGQLCEGTSANVFLVLADRLVTPPITAGCLRGVTRSLAIEWCGAEEEELPMSALNEATEIFLTSTTRRIQPVHEVDGRALPAPGPRTTEAIARFAQAAGSDLDP